MFVLFIVLKKKHRYPKTITLHLACSITHLWYILNNFSEMPSFWENSKFHEIFKINHSFTLKANGL